MTGHMRSFLGLLLTTGLILGASGCGDGQDHSKHDHGAPAATPQGTPTSTADPLKTCVVSGEELGKMGEPYKLTYKGQEIKLCCKACEKDFLKEPEKFLRKLNEAQKK